MRLFIAEKSELAKAIVDGLGGGEKRGGFWQCGASDRVVACVGHMLELLQPHEYDPELEKWSLATLPWSANPWKKKPVEKTADQLKVILAQLREADSVVHAGDPDDEGQLIVDEILKYADYQGPVKRVLINDNNVKIVQRSIANMRDNSEFAGLSASAEARSVGDLLYGVNITRAYTLVARSRGYDGVLHTGRVQTPILGMVERRCRENAHHKAAFYFLVDGAFSFEGVTFKARYKTTDTDQTDDKGRLLDKAAADAIAKAITSQAATVLSATTKPKERTPPLPYNLLKLQGDASRLFGFMPDKVKDVTQSLREKHKLITYNRSDSQYLSDEHHADAPDVLAAIAGTCPQYAALTKRADPKLKSSAFDSKKVTAHHGIIPTQAVVSIDLLSLDEKRIYMLIARAYIAQFWPNEKYDQTKLEVRVADRTFAVTSEVTTSDGWQLLYKADQAAAKDDDDENSSSVDVRALSTGQLGKCDAGKVLDKKTKPQPLYTVSSLLEDLTRVAKYVRNERLKKILIDRDKDKQGEHGGIGTPATRDAIIKNLFERGWFELQGKNVVTTQKAHDYYDVLPDQARYPDMTATWQEQQQAIAAGKLTADEFVSDLMQWIDSEIERVTTQGLNIKVYTQPCPKCGQPMRRVKGEHGFFWGCVDRDACKNIMKDVGGRPVAKEETAVSALHNCMACGQGLIRRSGAAKKGAKAGPPWWSCSGYPDCKQTYADTGGKPDYSKGKITA